MILFGFLDCPDELFNKMKLYCAKYIQVCKEINISFMPQEAQVSEMHFFRHFCNFPFPVFCVDCVVTYFTKGSKTFSETFSLQIECLIVVVFLK